MTALDNAGLTDVTRCAFNISTRKGTTEEIRTKIKWKRPVYSSISGKRNVVPLSLPISQREIPHTLVFPLENYPSKIYFCFTTFLQKLFHSNTQKCYIFFLQNLQNMFFKACTTFERQKQDCMTIFWLQFVNDINPDGSLFEIKKRLSYRRNMSGSISSYCNVLIAKPYMLLLLL